MVVLRERLHRLHVWGRELWKRPVDAGMVWLGYAGIIATVAFTQVTHAQETSARTSDICGVIVNIHHANERDLVAARTALRGTLAYLADPASQESPALYKRVKQNLPTVRGNVRAAEDAVKATVVPATCKPYEKRSK